MAEENEQAGGDLESMTTEQLEQHLDTQGSASANEQTPGNDANTGEQGEAGGTPDPMTIIQKRLDEMQREMGRSRGLQSRLDGLDSSVAKAVQKALEDQERKRYESNLPPEQREANQQAATRRQALEQYVREQSVAGLREQFGDRLDFLDQAMQERADQKMLGDVAQMAEDIMPGLSQGVADLFQKNYADLNSKDPNVVRQALEWNERSSDPTFVVLQLVKAQRSKASDGAAQYATRKGAEVRSASAGMRSTASGTAGAKSLDKYSSQELENMSMEQLEKLIPERK